MQVEYNFKVTTIKLYYIRFCFTGLIFWSHSRSHRVLLQRSCQGKPLQSLEHWSRLFLQARCPSSHLTNSIIALALDHKMQIPSQQCHWHTDGYERSSKRGSRLNNPLFISMPNTANWGHSVCNCILPISLFLSNFHQNVTSQYPLMAENLKYVN